MSTIVACAGFGAICGSSIATARDLRQGGLPVDGASFGYKDTLAAGSIAAGGTLGILIPPSVIMVIYGIMDRDQYRQALRGRHPAGHRGRRCSCASPSRG